LQQEVYTTDPRKIGIEQLKFFKPKGSSMKHPALLQLLCLVCIILLLLSSTLPSITCTSSVAAAYSQTGKELIIFEFFYTCSKSHAYSFFVFLFFLPLLVSSQIPTFP
jgi:hypothetical protein